MISDWFKAYGRICLCYMPILNHFIYEELEHLWSLVCWGDGPGTNSPRNTEAPPYAVNTSYKYSEELTWSLPFTYEELLTAFLSSLSVNYSLSSTRSTYISPTPASLQPCCYSQATSTLDATVAPCLPLPVLYHSCFFTSHPEGAVKSNVTPPLENAKQSPHSQWDPDSAKNCVSMPGGSFHHHSYICRLFSLRNWLKSHAAVYPDYLLSSNFSLLPPFHHALYLISTYLNFSYLCNLFIKGHHLLNYEVYGSMVYARALVSHTSV